MTHLTKCACLHFLASSGLLIGKDVFSPEVESSPAPSSTEPQQIPTGVKQTSRTSSFEIENLLKTAEQVNYVSYNIYWSYR